MLSLPQLMDGTCNENDFREAETGRFNIVAIARRVQRWMIVAVSSRVSVLVWMHVSSEMPICIVAVVFIVVVSHRPPDGDGHSRRLAMPSSSWRCSSL